MVNLLFLQNGDGQRTKREREISRFFEENFTEKTLVNTKQVLRISLWRYLPKLSHEMLRI